MDHPQLQDQLGRGRTLGEPSLAQQQEALLEEATYRLQVCMRVCVRVCEPVRVQGLL